MHGASDITVGTHSAKKSIGGAKGADAACGQRVEFRYERFVVKLERCYLWLVGGAGVSREW
eukprot:2003146-Prymnesium_polylepis.1